MSGAVWAAGEPEWANDENQKGKAVIVNLNSDGEIIADNYSTKKTLGIQSSFGLNFRDWHFSVDGDRVWPNESGVNVEIVFGANNISISGQPSEDKIKNGLKVRVANGRRSNYYVLIQFQKQTTDIEDDDVTITGGEIEVDGNTYSKVYDGNSIDITVKDGESPLVFGTDYTVTVDGEAVTSEDALPKDVKTADDGIYTIVIKGKGKYSETVTKYVKITPKGLTISAKEDNLTATVGEEKTLTADDFKIEGGLESENITLTTSEAITIATTDATTVTVDAETVKSHITVTGNDNYKATNYTVTYPSVTVSVGKIQISTDNVKAYVGTTADESKLVIGNADGYAVTYDGNEHGIGLVTVNGKTVDAKDYTVTYDGDESAPVHVKGNPNPDQPQSYTVTILFNEDKYQPATITGQITIARQVITIKANEGELVMQWNEDGTQDLTASKYLTIDNLATADAEQVTISGNLQADETGTGYTLTKGEAALNYGSAQPNDYVENWDAVTTGISVGVGEKPEDPNTWAEDANEKGAVTVYVNEKGEIVSVTYPGMPGENNTAIIPLPNDLTSWSYEETPTLVPEDGYGFTWAVSEGTTLTISGTPTSTIKEGSESRVKIVKDEEEGYLSVIFKVVKTITGDNITKGGDDKNEDGTIDDDDKLLYGAAEGQYVIYDGNSHGLNALVLNDGTELSYADGHYFVYYDDENGTSITGDPVDAGTYTATVVFSEMAGYTGAIGLPITIAPRPLTLTFEFETMSEGDELVYDIKEAENLVTPKDKISADDNIEVSFSIATDQNANGRYDVTINTISFKETDIFRPDNYDISVKAGDVEIHLIHGEGDTYTPEEGGEGTGGFSDPVGDVEIIDQSGQSGSGIHYNEHELFLAAKDYLTTEATKKAYAEEGVELFSRYDKDKTWTGGSFTINTVTK